MSQLLDLKDLEKRMDNWDSAKVIFSAFAELNLLHCFTAAGINAAEMLKNINSEQLDRLISAITGIERHYNTFEAWGCFTSFLLFFYGRISASLTLSEPPTMTTANPSQSQPANDQPPQDGEA